MASLLIGVLGVLVGILTIGQSLAILTFAMPTAREWLRDGRLTDARPLQRYRRSLLLLVSVLAVSLAGISTVFSEHMMAFVIGLGVGVVGSIGGLRKKDDLLADFVQVNAPSIGVPAGVKGLQWARAHASGINDYFRAAVEAYALTGDRPAYLAALTAAKVAAGAQRASMVTYLEAMGGDMAAAPIPRQQALAVKDRMTALAREIRLRDWSIAEAAAAKAELGAVAPAYLAALNRADASVFHRASR